MRLDWQTLGNLASQAHLKYKKNIRNNKSNCFFSIRFWMLDHKTHGPLFCPEPPAADGSTPGLLANSLRSLLGLNFDTALGVHFKSMDKDFFSQCVQSNWGWLDGESLLKK